MKIAITGYEAGPPGSRFLVLTTPCPFNKIWLEERKAGSIACADCEYHSGSNRDFVYCRRGDKRFKKESHNGAEQDVGREAEAMKGIRFRCIFCGREFDTVEECNGCEESH